MSMIIVAVSVSAMARCPCGLLLGRPGLVPRKALTTLAGYRIKRTGRVAGLLEFFECFATHGGVDVQIRHACDGAKLLQHEEDDAVVEQSAPVASADQVALLF